jgi:hypothetical protein
MAGAWQIDTPPIAQMFMQGFLSGQARADQKAERDRAEARYVSERDAAIEKQGRLSDLLAGKQDPRAMAENPEIVMQMRGQERQAAQDQQAQAQRVQEFAAKRAQTTDAVRTNMLRALQASKDPAALMPRLDAEIRRMSSGPNAQIDPFDLGGVHVNDGAGQFVHQAPTQEEMIAGGAAPPEKTLHGDNQAFAELFPDLVPGSPEFREAKRAWDLEQSRARAPNTVLQMPGGGEGMRINNETAGKFQQEIAAGVDALGRIADIRDLGDPKQFLTNEAWRDYQKVKIKLENPSIQSVPFVDRVTPEMEAQHAAQTRFYQLTDDLMLAARRALTGTGGGEAEMAKIEASLVSKKLDPVAYASALSRVEELTNRAIYVKQDMARNGINLDDPQYYQKLRERFNALPKTAAPATATTRSAGDAFDKIHGAVKGAIKQ